MGSLSGNVVHSGGGYASAGHNVYLYMSGVLYYGPVTTGSNGYFRFPSVYPGTYQYWVDTQQVTNPASVTVPPSGLCGQKPVADWAHSPAPLATAAAVGTHTIYDPSDMWELDGEEVLNALEVLRDNSCDYVAEWVRAHDWKQGGEKEHHLIALLVIGDTPFVVDGRPVRVLHSSP